MPITVIGVDDIKAKLDRLQDETTKLAIQRAGFRAAAKVFVEALRQTVPFDTGRLEGSIGFQVKKKDGRAIIGPDKRLNFIGRFHEFGTKSMAGDHWMQKAFDASAQEALEAYQATVLRLFDKHEFDDLIAALKEAEGMGD